MQEPNIVFFFKNQGFSEISLMAFAGSIILKLRTQTTPTASCNAIPGSNDSCKRRQTKPVRRVTPAMATKSNTVAESLTLIIFLSVIIMHNRATKDCEARAEMAYPIMEIPAISKKLSHMLITVAVPVMAASVFILPDAVRRVLYI